MSSALRPTPGSGAARRPHGMRLRAMRAAGPAAGARAAVLLAVQLGALAAVLAGAGCSPAVPEVQRLPRYREALTRPLAERVRPADAAVLARAHHTNRTYGEDVRPTAAAPGHPLAAVVRRVLAGLPAPVARVAEQHLAAVYLVEGDLGTATTEGVWSAPGGWGHAYIVLNLSALDREANAWATWKEQSAFRPAAGYALRFTLEPPGTDDREGAVRFIVLHELGHVLGLGLGVHGYWDDDPAPPAPAVPTAPPGLPPLSPFAALSWARVPGEAGEAPALRSRHAAAFPGPHFVDFYRFDQARSPLADAPALYAALARTDFPSLYGSLQVYDDFAEAFAIHVHTALLGKPYRVEVLREGVVVSTSTSCLADGRCPAKTAAVQALLAR